MAMVLSRSQDKPSEKHTMADTSDYYIFTTPLPPLLLTLSVSGRTVKVWKQSLTYTNPFHLPNLSASSQQLLN